MNGFAKSEVGLEWRTRGNILIFLARRDVYGFLFSVGRVLLTLDRVIQALSGWFSVKCGRSRANRVEEPVICIRAAEALLAHVKS